MHGLTSPVLCLFPFKFLIQLTFGNTCTVTFMSLCGTSRSLSRCLTTVHSQFMPLCHWPEYRTWSVRSIGPFRIRSKISKQLPFYTFDFVFKLHISLKIEFWLLPYKQNSDFLPATPNVYQTTSPNTEASNSIFFLFCFLLHVAVSLLAQQFQPDRKQDIFICTRLRSVD